jgi:hypothetical protein
LHEHQCRPGRRRRRTVPSIARRDAARTAGQPPCPTQIQLEVVRRYGTEQDVAPGDVLFADSHATYDLIVVLDGVLEIVEHIPTRPQLEGSHGR